MHSGKKHEGTIQQADRAASGECLDDDLHDVLRQAGMIADALELGLCLCPSAGVEFLPAIECPRQASSYLGFSALSAMTWSARNAYPPPSSAWKRAWLAAKPRTSAYTLFGTLISKAG